MDDAAAEHIANAMRTLQNDICQRQETGNVPAGKAYQAALDLLKENGYRSYSKKTPSDAL